MIRLGFTPGQPVTASIGSQRYRLPARATVRLRVRGGGLLEIGATRGPNDASYYAHCASRADTEAQAGGRTRWAGKASCMRPSRRRAGLAATRQLYTASSAAS